MGKVRERGITWVGGADGGSTHTFLPAIFTWTPSCLGGTSCQGRKGKSRHTLPSLIQSVLAERNPTHAVAQKVGKKRGNWGIRKCFPEEGALQLGF